jgi:hypothetical protein
MTWLGLWVPGRESTEVKCCFHYISLRVHALNMTCHRDIDLDQLAGVFVRILHWKVTPAHQTHFAHSALEWNFWALSLTKWRITFQISIQVTSSSSQEVFLFLLGDSLTGKEIHFCNILPSGYLLAKGTRTHGTQEGPGCWLGCKTDLSPREEARILTCVTFVPGTKLISEKYRRCDCVCVCGVCVCVRDKRN